MKRRNLIWTLGALTGFMLIGCTDDSYRGTIDVELTVEKDIPHEVRMTIGAPEDIVDKSEEENGPDAKGSGVIVDVNGFSGKDFYVYAFNKDGLTTLAATNARDSIMCLIDGTVDDPESLMGRKAVWNPETEFVEWESGDGPIYYPMGEGAGHIYNFFAYYLDDMEVENSDFHRTDDEIQIDIDIDGSQDIMSSKAAPTEEQLMHIKDHKELVYMLYSSYGYYTATRGLHPNFIFGHHLVKLDFKLVPGGTPGSTKNVTVEKIEVVSKHKGRFTVADTKTESTLRIDFEEDMKELQLKESDGSEFIPRLVTTYQDGAVVDGVVDDMGSLLVAPDDEYTLLITLSETDENDSQIHDPYPLVRSLTYVTSEGQKSFEAGDEFLVTLTIYGKMDVRVSTDMLNWNEGGFYAPPTEDVPNVE